MKLTLISLTITNFKGIKHLVIEPDGHETSIYAANEAGKTTISDAWHWLLTGKNSNDKTDFNIKNTVNTDLNRADHEVSAVILADGSKVILKKVFKEKWQKKRGEQTAEFTGNETLYYCNDVPQSQSEYQNKINGFLPDSVLKMITNPLFFNTNTTNWGWQKRREVLLSIAGTIDTSEILNSISTAKNMHEVSNLSMVLNSGKSVAEYKREISARKKKIKDDIILIPARIDEQSRGILDPLDYVAIQNDITLKNSELSQLDQLIVDKNKALQAEHQQIQERQNKIHQLTTRRSQIVFDIKSSISNNANEASGVRNRLTSQCSSLKRDRDYLETILTDTRNKKTASERKIAELRIKFEAENAKAIQFEDGAFECPTCMRAFEADDIEEKKIELENNFKRGKQTQLDAINANGQYLKKQIEEFNELISATESKIVELTEKLSGFNKELESYDNEQNTQIDPVRLLDDQLSNNDEYIQLNIDIAALERQNNNVKPVDNSEFISKKNLIAVEIDQLKKQLNTKEQIEKAEQRIVELKKEESTLAQQLADLERTEFLLEDFNRSKMDVMESRINGKFRYVKFKLFDRQVNGGEVETCETMYKGVPFSDLNTAGKIWAGMDIINTLSDHYSVSAPIFLDNRESVTNVPETSSQIINLVVSEQDKEIRVVVGKKLLEVA